MLRKLTCLLIYLLAGLFALPLNQAYAAFDPNYLLPDYELVDWQTMDYHEIQDFLLRNNSTLATYVDPVVRQLPAQIIFDASTVYQINPKVLLALLQKEQSLIEDQLPSSDQYDWATGFAVCDSCSKSDPALQQYRGFGTQVDRAAWRFRYYLDHPDEFRFKSGNTYLIDGRSVIMTNDATRALYTYTPHIHGNENFVRIWQRWFARDYPDGAVLKNKESGELWLIQGGKRRKFASVAVALSRTNLDAVIPASPVDLATYIAGQPIKFAEYTLLRSPKGTVYLYARDVKRGIASREVFKMLGFNPEEVTPASWDDLNAIPDGAALTTKSSYPTGALLQDVKTGGVWYVQDGVRHALIARELLGQYRGKKILKTDAAQLERFETGTPMLLADGMLIKRSSASDVAVITNGVRRRFASWEAFSGLGYNPAHIMIVSDRLWNMHPEGAVINVEKTEAPLS